MILRGALKDSENINHSIVSTLTEGHLKHTNCARSYVALYQSNPEEAEKVFENISAWFSSIS